VICIHRKRQMPIRAKGLCQTCWRHHGHMYPSRRGLLPDLDAADDDEPATMAEVDAIIAEQTKTAWWLKAKEADEED